MRRVREPDQPRRGILPQENEETQESDAQAEGYTTRTRGNEEETIGKEP